MRTQHATYAVIPDELQVTIAEEELDLDVIPPQALVVEAETTVISAGTELAIYTALAPGVRVRGSWNAYPYRPGYGLVGRIMATGEAVDRVSVGDRVFCFGQHASHQVYNMVSGKAVRSIFKVDEDLPAEQLVMLRMAMVAIHAPQITKCDPGDTVAVFGLGTVGNLAAQLYRQAGLHVIGVDPVQSRCKIARQVGIETIVDVPPEHQLEAIHELTDGRGTQVTVEAVGHSAVVNTSIAACADFGQVILLGSPRASYEADMTPAFREIHLRWLTVRGALEWRLPPYDAPGIQHSVESNLRRLIDALRSGQLNVSTVTSHVIKPSELPQAYDGLLNRKDAYLGTVIDWRTERS
jgi:2-desacetyl-2-hydroxyethyl bacteriochlorophyllide A dehydrogenase